MDSEQNHLILRHVGNDETVKCPQCGREFVPVEAQRYCAFCGVRLEGPATRDLRDQSGDFDLTKDPQSGVQEDAPAAAQCYCPWEEQEQLGLSRGLIRTIARSLSSPRSFFAMLPPYSGFALPLLYALILETFGGMMSTLWVLVLPPPWLTSSELTREVTISLAFMIPVLAVLGTFASAFVLHGCLVIIGRATESFQATFRVVCYSSAPELMNAIPLLGPFIALIWKLYLVFVGLREIHRATTATILAALLLPIVLASAIALATVAWS